MPQRPRAAEHNRTARPAMQAADPERKGLQHRYQPQDVGHRRVVIPGAEEHQISRRHEVKDG